MACASAPFDGGCSVFGAATADLRPSRTNATQAPPPESPQAGVPPNEALRLALPVIAVLVFCVFGWYARNRQRRASRPNPDTPPPDGGQPSK
ncbi:MAG: hypothetical protein JXQ71_04120 [Verrucomicrobia bacterium]|nr:hypothetical protein [Verrucomicrobiota bacterium]